MTHSLTAEEADRVNALTGFSRERGETEEENPGAVEGDSYDTFNGVVVVGVREDGTVIGFAASDDSEPADDVDESPVTDDERNAREAADDAEYQAWRASSRY